MTSDTSEKGLESLICSALTGLSKAPVTGVVGEKPEPYGGSGWIYSRAEDY